MLYMQNYLGTLAVFLFNYRLVDVNIHINSSYAECYAGVIDIIYISVYVNVGI